MKVALVNPRWTFDGSIYFGCREPHLPLELGYAQAMLAAKGHDARIIDAQLAEGTPAELHLELSRFRPDMTVVATAPSYLFWRCAPPELRVPMRTIAAVRDVAGRVVAVGPHASTTPSAAARKLGADAVVLGECEEALVELADTDPRDWGRIDGIAQRHGDEVEVRGRPRTVDMRALPALDWPVELLHRHQHHHHRFDARPDGPGAEMEASRGCPYKCTFCAKENFRDKFRARPLDVVLRELDGLIAKGVTYVYFIDEIFLPNRELLLALAERPVRFGVQARIDLFDEAMLELLGRAGCVSIEAGVESITPEGRSLLGKKCRLSTDELTHRLVHAKRHVPFVQANLLEARTDDVREVKAWREKLESHGIWSNEPVPMFPYPGSPEYRARWGLPDDQAWERALAHYLEQFDAFCDFQDQRPRPLAELERVDDA